MDIKRLIIPFAVFAGISACHAHQLNHSTEKQLFKNYALSMCLATEYKEGDIYNDSLKALNGYREFENMSLEANGKLNKAYQKWSVIAYPSKKGGNVELARCIDFQNSDDVVVIFENNNPCKDAQSWNTKEEYNAKCSK